MPELFVAFAELGIDRGKLGVGAPLPGMLPQGMDEQQDMERAARYIQCTMADTMMTNSPMKMLIRTVRIRLRELML